MFFDRYKVKNMRRYNRFPVDYLVKYGLADSPGIEPLVSNLKDISAGGLKFWSEHFLPEGSLLRVSVCTPPLNRVIEALARVVRVRRSPQNLYYIAVSFIEIPAEDQAAINQFVEGFTLSSGQVFQRKPQLSRSGNF